MLRNPIITTPLGPPPPPPPLSLSTSHGRTRAPHHSFPAYAGARHTLGPTFSEEEDGDDSEFIAEKMAKLGLGKYGQGPGQAQAQDRQNVSHQSSFYTLQGGILMLTVRNLIEEPILPFRNLRVIRVHVVETKTTITKTIIPTNTQARIHLLP
jgi:hypothetical protein